MLKGSSHWTTQVSVGSSFQNAGVGALLFLGEGKFQADTEHVHHRELTALHPLLALVSQPPKHIPTRNSPPAPTPGTKEVGG